MDSTKEKFEKLYQQWKRETIFHSSSTIINRNKNYQEIIGMGKEVLPFIFEKMLWHEYGHWYEALTILTGENPITKDMWGYILKMNEAWLDWARKNGYITATKSEEELIKKQHLDI